MLLSWLVWVHFIISFTLSSPFIHIQQWKQHESQNMPMIFWAKQQLKIIMHQSLLYNYKVKLPKVTFLITYMYRRWGDHNNQKIIRSVYFNVSTCMENWIQSLRFQHQENLPTLKLSKVINKFKFGKPESNYWQKWHVNCHTCSCCDCMSFLTNTVVPLQCWIQTLR